MTTVFIRDDDVGERSEALCAVVRLLLAEELPVNYQAIPARLTAEAAAFMRDRQHEHPDLISVNQHGYCHEQVIGGKHRWSEFAGGRSYADQHEAIARGRERLRDRLGDTFDASIFTPPQHRYDAATLRALADLGFETMSASVHTSFAAACVYRVGRWFGMTSVASRGISYHGGVNPVSGLREISVAIDVDFDRDAAGRRREKTADRLIEEFRRARSHHEIVGIMLHHETYENPRRLAPLGDFLRRLKLEPDLRFATIGEIAATISG